MALPDYVSLVTGTSRTSGFSSTNVASGVETTGSAIDNATNLDGVLDAEVVWSYSVAPTANRTVEIYILYALDGTNYPSRETGGILVRAFSPPANTSTHRLTVGDYPLLPYPFKLHVRNVDTGQTITITINATTRKEKAIID